jgi:multiple sugar transport system permease protein
MTDLVTRTLSYFDRRVWAYALLLPSLVLVGVIILYPVASGVELSFQDYRLNRPDVGRPFIGLDNYARLVADPVARGAFVNTVRYVGVGVTSQLLLGLAAALLLNRPSRGVMIARLVVMLPWFMPPVVTAHMWNLMLDSRVGVINDALTRVGLVDASPTWFAEPGTALWTVLAVELWRSFPFFALFILAGLQAVPRELEEAAHVDGAGAWMTFRHIILPLLAPVIVVATVLQVIRLVNIPDLLIILTGGGPGNSTQVLSLYAFLTAYSSFDFGYAATICVALMIGLMGFTIVYVRVTGVTKG